jgi:hypothetical protein
LKETLTNKGFAPKNDISHKTYLTLEGIKSLCQSAVDELINYLYLSEQEKLVRFSFSDLHYTFVRIWIGHRYAYRFRPDQRSDIGQNFRTFVSIRIEHGPIFEPKSVRIRIGHILGYAGVLSRRDNVVT